MPGLFVAKIRRIGTSAGVIIPNEYMKKENLKIGEILEFSHFKQKNIEKALKLWGAAKGAQPFEREEEEDRV